MGKPGRSVPRNGPVKGESIPVEAVSARDPGKAAAPAPGQLPDLLALARSGTVHFMGIAGAGMSVLAELLLRAGGSVSGCDLNPGQVGEALHRLGAVVMDGHSPDHVAGVEAVVFTAAVPPEHPELMSARDRGIPVLKRAEALGALVNTGEVVAVAGTHGKTTTTAMVTDVLIEAGLDPTGLVGGRIPAWGGGLRPGSGEVFVVEADEYDRSFLTLRPAVAVVTAVEADHLDTYGSLDAIELAFRQFLGPVPAGGLVAVCADDEGAISMLDSVHVAGKLAYGTSGLATLRGRDVVSDGEGSRLRVELKGRLLGQLEVPVPGLHNVRNALAAVAVGLHYGADFEVIRRGLGRFRGVARRFQQLGMAGGAVVVDDYAHHPTALEATLSAARAAYGDRRLVAVFQPHLYTRTRDFAREFGRALAGADVVWVTDVYPAREKPVPGVSGLLVARAAETAGAAQVHYHDGSLEDLRTEIRRFLKPGDVCVFMGAGDIEQVAKGLMEPPAGSLSRSSVEPDSSLMAGRTRYRVGGPASQLWEADSPTSLVEVLNECRNRPYLVLGGGTNLLVSDDGVSDPVLCLGGQFKELRFQDNTIVAGAAARLAVLVQGARRHALGGWDFLEAIPGSVGGALAMNAGSPSQGIWDLVEWVEVMLPGRNAAERITGKDVNPSYRKVELPREAVITRACFRGVPADPAAVEKAHGERRDRKLRTQPYDLPSCGSVWQNPPGRAAWELIHGVGLRGERRGGARISERHANFIVNEGTAMAADIVYLMRETRRRVHEEYGTRLRPEVRLWGFPADLLKELGAADQFGEGAADQFGEGAGP